MRNVLKTAGTVATMAAMVAATAALLFWRRGEEGTQDAGTSPRSGAREGGNLVIMSPHQEGIQVEFERAFSDWHKRTYGSPVDITWIDVGGTTKDEQFVQSSFKEHPAGGDFDIFFGGGTDPYLSFMEEGITFPFRLPGEQLSRLPKEIGGVPLYEPSHNWYGTSVTAFGILYNKAVLKRLGLRAPVVWEDLAKPEFFGLVSLADPRYSGSVRMMFEIILQAHGWEKGFELIIRMGGNATSFASNASQAVREITLAEAACGLAIDFYAWAEIAEGRRDRMEFVMPSGLTIFNPDAIAVLKGAPHAEVAKRFVTFVMSEEGQRLWMLPVGAAGGPREYALSRMPVLPWLYEKYRDQTVITGNPFEMKLAMKYDRERGSVRKDIVNDLIGTMVIDTHSELRKAWKAVARKGMRANDLRRLTRLPVTEEEAIEMAKTRWRDASFRARTVAEWVEFCRRKYRDIVKELR